MAGAVHVHAQEKTRLRPNELVSLDGTPGQAYRVLATNDHATHVARVNVFSFKPHPPVPVFFKQLDFARHRARCDFFACQILVR